MVYLYRNHQDDGLMVSRKREEKWEAPCSVCAETDKLLGIFRSRDGLAAFLEDGRGFLYSDRMIDQTLYLAELLDAWEV